jgi:Protein of unknown function (DUF1579)
MMRFLNHVRSSRAAAVAALFAIFTAATATVLLVAAPLTAQQPPKAGPEHEQFKEWEGTWDATIKSMGGESKGVGTWKVGLGGLWLLEHFKADLGMPFEGHGGTSYDPATKKYVNVWIDSMSTRPMMSEGTYDKSTKTLTMVGDMPLPDGKAMKVTMTSVTKDADTKTFTLTGAEPGGKQIEMLHITYKRRAK